MTSTQPREGYWFSDRSGVLPHGDGRPIIVGEEISVTGKLVICKNALHGSFDPFDGLRYAPGPMLHKVLFTGQRIEHSDKVGSRRRRVLASVDAEVMLRTFARRQALSVADSWPIPTIVREYLKSGDETLRGAAETAARNAAWIAAWSAAWSAARNPAWSAAWSAAKNPAWSAAWSAARKMFNEMVDELF